MLQVFDLLSRYMGSLRITVGSIFRPCREIRALLHARLFCIPDLRSERVECKVHAHRQRHRVLEPTSTRQEHSVGIAMQRDSCSC